MKTKILTATIIFSITLLMTSCSKESVQVPVTTTTANQGETSKMAPGDVQKNGSIKGMISPSKNSVTLYLVNEFRTYGPFYSEPSSGIFKFGNVIPGDYKLIIINPNAGASDDWAGAITMLVTISQGAVTDVGVINL